MFRTLLLFLLLLFLWACNPKSRKVLIEIDELDSITPKIILLHPTVKNITTFQYLVESGLFPVGNSNQFIGLYHSRGSYDYSQSVDYIETNKLSQWKLVEISDKLKPSTLFKTNDCSKVFQTLFERSNGAIFWGGPDLPPATYGQPTNLLTEITDIHRHYLELSFLFHLLGGSQDTLFLPLLTSKPNYVVLGICLGMQTMNVATGGTMIQDIPSELYGKVTVEDVLSMPVNQQHRNYYTNYGLDKSLIWGHFHEILYQHNSLFDSLNGLSKSNPNVWSSHHQALGKLGKGIVPAAWSMDSLIVEAVAHETFKRVLGVQFHPEVTAIYNNETLKQRPFSKERKTYNELYPNESGALFHRNFWGHFSSFFKQE